MKTGDTEAHVGARLTPTLESRHLFFKIWWAALAVKIAIAIFLPLVNDEAYYWVWGHFPQWSYFDHPPMVGWLFFLGRAFENVGVGGVRIPAIVLGHLSLLIWREIIPGSVSESKKNFWLIFVLLSPFLGPGSLIVTPDIPLVFFWSLALWFLLRIFGRNQVLDYIGLGVALGLGFCSKYPIVLFVPIALAYTVVSQKWRKIRWGLVAFTIFFGVLFSLPVIYWNAENQWSSFAFQLHHGFAATASHRFAPLEYLGAQLLILFPTVVWFALQKSKTPETRIFRYFGWAPILFFLYSSFHAPVEANWTIVAYPALLTLAVINASELKVLKLTAALWATVTCLLLSEVAFTWMPIDAHKLKTSESHRYDLFLPFAESHSDLYFGSYQMAAAVSYDLKKMFLKLGGMNRHDFYDFLPQAYPERDRFWVGKEIQHPLPKWLGEKDYEVARSISLSDEFEIVEVQKRASHTDH